MLQGTQGPGSPADAVNMRAASERARENSTRSGAPASSSAARSAADATHFPRARALSSLQGLLHPFHERYTFATTARAFFRDVFYTPSVIATTLATASGRAFLCSFTTIPTLPDLCQCHLPEILLALAASSFVLQPGAVSRLYCSPWRRRPCLTRRRRPESRTTPGGRMQTPRGNPLAIRIEKRQKNRQRSHRYTGIHGN